MLTPEPTPRKAWLMLALGVSSQAAGSVLLSTPAFLIPALQQHGLSLGSAGLLSAAPTIGMVLTLVAWGAAADKYGEKWMISGGLALTAASAAAAMLVGDNFFLIGVFFWLAGMAAASTSAASGRVVVGWFPKHRRGLAMGIRQMSIPIGATVAALAIPTLAEHGIAQAIALSVALNALFAVACAIGISNPPRVAHSEHATSNPYKRSDFLLRIHVVSALLVVPQFTVTTFGLVWMVTQLHWTAFVAGLTVGVAQFAGALGRIAVGMLSDHARSRVRPLRWVAISACAVMFLLAVSGAIHPAVAAIAFVFATVVSVADNGLAFTAVAEAAGAAWSGKALGIQNTGQFIAASAVGPGMGVLITAVGYSSAFAIAGLFPAIAIMLVPKHDEGLA